jgi:serine phosphatase RsbU (regulator of sigma subunit)
MNKKEEIIEQITANTIHKKIDKILEESSKKNEEDFKLSMELANEAKLLSEEHFYTKGLANSLIQLGKRYQNISNYVEAMKCALQAIELFKGLKDVKGEAVCLDILGGVYNFLGDYSKRLDCNLKSLELREKAKDVPAQLSATNNIGDTYMSMGDFDKALKYFKHCLTFPDLTDHIQAIVYYNIGEVYFSLENYKLAKKNIAKGLSFAKKCNYWQILIASYQMEARMLIGQKENERALNLLTKALKLVLKNAGKEEEYPLYRYFSEAYKNLSLYHKAYSFLNKYNQIKEELLNENNAQQLKKLEFDFQFKKIKDEAVVTKEKNKLLTRAFNKIELQRNEIKDKNQSITDSIRYAKRIQNSILPSNEKINNCLANSFIFYQPKDIVSGDFYWVDKIDDEVIFSIIDCTGHGVPGAFVSLIANNGLNKIILEKKITKPSAILTEIDVLMSESFRNAENTVNDGMDMGVCTWNTKTNTLQFSGAYHSLFMYDGEKVVEIKGNRESIGYSFFLNKTPFVNHIFKANTETTFYLSSDGFPDQFGGEKGKKLKWKGFKELLNRVGAQPINVQRKEIQSYFNKWKGDLEQLDDVCMIGVKL